MDYVYDITPDSKEDDLKLTHIFSTLDIPQFEGICIPVRYQFPMSTPGVSLKEGGILPVVTFELFITRSVGVPS